MVIWSSMQIRALLDADPHDSGSVLSVLSVAAELGGLRIDWKGGRDARQFLECCSDPTAATSLWSAILAVPSPTPRTNAIIDLGATNRVLFYRIRAVRQDGASFRCFTQGRVLALFG